MGSEGKIKSLSSEVMICLVLSFLTCLFISFCDARSIDIQQVTQRQGYDEPKQYQLTKNQSSNQLTIVGDEPQSSYPQGTNLGVTRTLRDQIPSSYLLKIKDFSELRSKPPRYESAAFDSAGFKWRLIFYQNGNENDGGKDHISLYVRIENLPDKSQVDVDLKLFVYNQHQDKYLTVQDGNIKRFRETKKEWGFGQLLPLSNFSDPSNGYLVEDVCVLGVEIFVITPAKKTETLSFLRKPANGKFTWKILHFSNLEDTSHYSPNIVVGERNWIISVHPKGNGSGKGKYLAVYLFGWSYPPNAVEVRTYGWATLRLLNQRSSNDYEKQTGGWYNIYPYVSWGIQNFIPLKDLHDESNGYLVNDTIILQVEFDIVSETKVVSN